MSDRTKSIAIMLAGLCAASLAGCAGDPASSGNAPEASQNTGKSMSGNLDLEISGEGRWSVTCEGKTLRGRTDRSQSDNRERLGFGSVYIQAVTSADCSYEAGATDTLRIRALDEGLTCPFGSYSDGICESMIGAGGTGSFSVTLK